MALEKERYTPELTSKSQTELQKFSTWYSKNQGGNWPNIIGGWAVWSYYPQGFGSRDVDLVLPSDDWIDNIMKKTYFPANGFKEYRLGDFMFGEIHHGKPIQHHDEEDVVFFDLISAETPRVDNDKLGVFVDWNWIYENQQQKDIGDGASINVPELELLITLKIIGCLSRSRKLKRAPDVSYFQGKIWKDCYDIANLTNHLKPDDDKLLNNFVRTKLTKELIQEFLEACDGRKNALEEGNSKMEPLEELAKLFKK